MYCDAGRFHIDPWWPVEHALITHAHSDHATPGSEHYLCSTTGREVLRQRVQRDADIQSLDYGRTLRIGDVNVSLHPAGHLLGSAQIRVEHNGRVEVVTGDYKTQPDPTCEPFEPLTCHRLITESTFGLPIYRWQDPAAVALDINTWWLENQREGRTSIVLAYALGKAQRVLSMLDESIGPIVVHGSVKRFVDVYQQQGVHMPMVTTSTAQSRKECKGRGLVVAPPSVLGSPWLRAFTPYSSAFASGWMALRGNRRRRGVDRGFVVSDHADWPGLLKTIRDCGCTSVGVTHGYTQPLARYLTEQLGLQADILPTRYEGEADHNDQEPQENNTDDNNNEPPHSLIPDP